MATHKAGFVSIIGKPNVGKSTLMNQLAGFNLSIITNKAQTTRHRIRGVISGDDYQIIYSDTPGIINAKYELQEKMMGFVEESLQDADLILFVTDIYEKFNEEQVVERLGKTNLPILLLINKIDKAKSQQEVVEKMEYWKEKLPNVKEVLPISALESFNLDSVIGVIKDMLPEHEAFFPKDTLTDRSERFFASEIIREKIFLNLEKEVPYSCEVIISEFKEDEKIIRMRAEIIVERDSQKGILIGKAGSMLKRIGTASRKDLEQFFDKKVHLETYIKVESNWRKKDKQLKRFGYEG